MRFRHAPSDDTTETTPWFARWRPTILSSTFRDLTVVPFLVTVSSVAPRPVHIVIWVSAAIAVQALVGVCFWGEAPVLVRTLSIPGLAGHTQDSDGGWTSVCTSTSNLTVLRCWGLGDGGRGVRYRRFGW